MPPDLQPLFEKKLSVSQLIKPGEKVFVGCSGGPDSVALFHLLRTLPPAWKIKIGLFHFHHGLRGRSADQDAVFVKKLGKTFKVPVVVGKGKVREVARREGHSLEEAARKARYAFFAKESTRRKITKVALAHTLDDQAETVLMRMIQGTGLQGLRGIRERLKQGKLVFVRPVLGFTKSQILEYLQAHKFFFRKDESNDSEAFLRNRIRRKLFPVLESHFNPKVKEALARIPAIVSEEAEALLRWETEAYASVCKEMSKKRRLLDRRLFEALPAALQFRVLRKALEQLDPRSGLSYDAWSRLQPDLYKKRGCHSLKRDLDLALTPENIIIYKKNSRR